MRNKTPGYISAVIITLSLAIPVTYAQMPPPTEDDAHAFPAQDHYSPYAGRGFPTNVYWGDTHLHTGMSMDAGAFGARLMPEDAHRFARGEELTSSTGQRVKLSRPLDFLSCCRSLGQYGFLPAFGCRRSEDARRSDRKKMVRHGPGGRSGGSKGRGRNHTKPYDEHHARSACDSSWDGRLQSGLGGVTRRG